MSGEILSDRRIRAVPWEDLRSVRPIRRVVELALSAPWLIASLWCAGRGWYVPALALSFVFFLTGLRQVHNAFHHVLGLPRLATDWVMVALSAAMLGAMHAVKFNHLQHHKHCLDDDDVEGMCARMSFLRALAFGPIFPIVMHVHAFRRAGRSNRRWMCLEVIANGVVIGAAFGVAELSVLRYHVVAMLVGQCLTSFFAVWTVHHDCDRYHYIARTIRSRLGSFFTFNMFYHVEHHLFPKVPTCNLPELAARLDRYAPELQAMRVFSMTAIAKRAHHKARPL